MPSNRIHAPACLACAVVALPASLLLGASLAAAAQISAGCALGTIVTPDLDLVNPLDRVPVLGWLYGAYWFGYRAAIPHRDRYSHAPIVGTLGRALYLLPLWFALWLVTGLGPGWIIAGLAVADTTHTFLDAFWRER